MAACDLDGAWRGVGWLIVLLAACTSAPLLPPAPPVAEGLVRRHFDQVCRVQAGDLPVVQVSEIFDTLGLSEALAEIGAQPFPLEPGSTRVRWRTVDFISRYGRDGKPGIMGVWDTSLDSASALRVERILRGRARAISGLLVPEGFRTVAVLSNYPTLEVAPPVACAPHVKHDRGERPRGLPDGVALTNMTNRFRPRRLGARASSTAMVQLRLDREGTVTEVEPLAGDSVVMAAARNIISRLQFDPALRNGEAVAGQAAYSFRFSESYLSRGGRKLP